MNVFKLPRRLCKEISALLGNFWWGKNKDRKGIHWKSWDCLAGAKNSGGLGFRNLEDFNVALLGKHVWRFLNDPTSLVAQVYNSKYHRNSCILDAKVGNAPSFIWRSVWAAKEVTKEGLIWQVGNGRSIKIWKHRWLPKPSSYCVKSLVSSLGIEARVSDLIIPELKVWNEKLIRDHFGVEEAELICSMPISKREGEDKRIWIHCTDGKFNVKSAYHMARDIRRREEGEVLGGGKEADRWRKLWSLNILGATKNFVWRACTNSLPSKALLLKKSVGVTDKCPICKTENETILHALWQCTAVNDVWACKGSGVLKWSAMAEDFRDLWDRLCLKLNSSLLEEVIVILRGIWHRRNKFVFENIFSGPAQVIEGAIQSLDGFREALRNNETNSKGGSPVSTIKQW
ncbi:uncharacterized protein LOC121253538 [Juglans microcarpa x Juglans regia]|uniref:uncharacterized protein LOC121253538 n=1 Tax=Juglans microcarpa x Juglans regia TaxID=2249226 RepID=UPI001B7DB499|nr:uncharacterized protein LOC121253538 [Juglans microcarpa x Juglans regia]